LALASALTQTRLVEWSPTQGETPLRFYFAWRLANAGVDVLWLTPATHLTVNPLAHLRTSLKGGTGLTLAVGMASRVELAASTMYVGGGVTPDGPVATLLRDTFTRWKQAHLKAGGGSPSVNSKGVDVSRFAKIENFVLSDAVLSAVGCNRTHRLSMQEEADYDRATLDVLLHAIQSRGSAVPLPACAEGAAAEEALWVATELEFGSLSRTQTSLQASYAAAQTQTKAAPETAMPLLVTVTGDRPWDSRWRLAQMAWWERGMPAMGQWPDVYKRVFVEGAGRVIELQGVTMESAPTPVIYLALVHWFVQVTQP